MYRHNLVQRSEEIMYNWISTHCEQDAVNKISTELRQLVDPKEAKITKAKNHLSEWERLQRAMKGVK